MEIMPKSEQITKTKLIAELKRLAEIDHPAFAHREADDLLLDFINDTEIEEAFEAITKWYE